MKIIKLAVISCLLGGQLFAQLLGEEQPRGNDLVRPETFYKLHPALANQQVSHPDSVSFYEYFEHGRWEAAQSARLQYDAKGRLIRLTYFQEMGNWVPYRRTEIRYNQHDQITRMSFFFESNRDYLEHERHEYQYHPGGELASHRHYRRQKDLQWQLVDADSLAWLSGDSLPQALELLQWESGNWQVHKKLHQIQYAQTNLLPSSFVYSVYDSVQKQWLPEQEFQVQHWRLGFKGWSHWLGLHQPASLIFQQQGTESPYHYRPTDFTVLQAANDGRGMQPYYRMRSNLAGKRLVSLRRSVFENNQWIPDQIIQLSWYDGNRLDSVLALPLRPNAAPRYLLHMNYDQQGHPAHFESREEVKHGQLQRRHFAYNNTYNGSGSPNLFETAYVDAKGEIHPVIRQEYHYQTNKVALLPPGISVQISAAEIQDRLRIRTHASGLYEKIQILDVHGLPAWQWEPKLPAHQELELSLHALAPGAYQLLVVVDGRWGQANFVKN